MKEICEDCGKEVDETLFYQETESWQEPDGSDLCINCCHKRDIYKQAKEIFVELEKECMKLLYAIGETTEVHTVLDTEKYESIKEKYVGES